VDTDATLSLRELTPERIVRLEDDAVVFLDQRRLPGEEVELRWHSAEEVAGAIRTLAVRGAPAIGIAAAYGYGAELNARFAALNPSFDVTPGSLIDAIVSEESVHRRPYAESLPR
jgi:methylthioribose-1-phosphate isomerase